MKKTLLLYFLIIPNLVCAYGYTVQVTTARTGTYICYDGRVLSPTPGGLAWQAKRGCFMSQKPCSHHNAEYYGLFNNRFHLQNSYVRCRQYYPWRLGME